MRQALGQDKQKNGKTISKMHKANIFDGDSYYAQFVQATYKRLISRKWVTYSDIMSDHLGLRSPKELSCNVSKCDNYGELKKAFRDVRKIINDRLGQISFEDEGCNRNKRFRYIGADDDPLSDLRNAKAISNLRLYWQFCQDSAGFFPMSWLDYFFKDSLDLLEIKGKRRKGEQVLAASEDRNLINIELLPFLYEAIKEKKVLAIRYRQHSGEELSLTVSPHFLKEFNGRWYLFGYVSGSLGTRNHVALDRIVGRPGIKSDAIYVEVAAHYYEDYFKNIVGITHKENAQIEDVRIRAHTDYMFKLTETKKLHLSQKVVVSFGEHTDGKYGEFSVQVEINKEFIGRILQMGDGLEVVSPEHVRRLFAQRVEALANRYKDSKIP